MYYHALDKRNTNKCVSYTYLQRNKQNFRTQTSQYQPHTNKTTQQIQQKLHHKINITSKSEITLNILGSIVTLGTRGTLHAAPSYGGQTLYLCTLSTLATLQAVP